MTRKLRSLVAVLVNLFLLASWYAWTAWGVGGILSIAVLLWMLWPKGAPPVVPDRLPTAKEIRAGTTPAGTPKPASQPASRPAPTDKEVFQATYFDPNDERLDPRYTHEVKLTKEQIAEVGNRIDLVRRLQQSWERRLDYFNPNSLGVTSPEVAERFYERVKSGKGFKQPDLPELWAKYADAEGPNLDLLAFLRNGYTEYRIAGIKAAVIRGRATEGDLKFLQYAIETLVSMHAEMQQRYRQAYKLKQLLDAEGI